MKYTAHQIKEKYNKAYSVKSSWDTEYREVFEWCMPARDGYQKAVAGEPITPDFQDRRENLYSSVGEQSASEFTNTMQEVLCPPSGDWISLRAGSRIPENNQEAVNEELEKLCGIANEYKNNSSFDMAFAEFCMDLFAGTACMLVLSGTPKQPIIFRAVPLREYSLEEGANGEVHAIYRKYQMKREFMKTQWKEIKDMKLDSKNCEKEIELIECTYYDYDLDLYRYNVINSEDNKIIVERESKTNPFVTLRWNKCAGEPYGRGVGLTALNDIKTLNLVKYYSLRNFAFNTPPLLVQEDAMLDVDGLEMTPWSLNVVPDTQTSIRPLQIQTDHNIESYKVQELTMEIKRNTFGNTLPNEGARQLTATEIRARMMEMRRALNSVFGRLVTEFQIPLVKRIFEVLIDIKEVSKEFDVTKIDGFMYKTNVITPMMKILRQSEAQAIMSAVGTLAQFDPSGSLIQQTVKLNELLPHFLELSGMPNRFINTVEELESEQRKQQQQAQQAQAQAIQTDVQMANAKEMGKAEAKAVENASREI